ncbi:MAG: 5-formyltetrahydrofolate cyclo-ligase [bacterium]|nr:5-formyltetrahydrofolate cyclo-ligase [bacterium]
MEKSELRKQLLAWRKSLSWNEVIKRSEYIGIRLFTLSEFRRAKRILFYVSYNNEVYTHQLIKFSLEYQKKVFVPFTRPQERTLWISELVDFDQDLSPNTYNILEPKPECIRLADPKELDLVIVPGIAFDISGNRIGHGRGYYDNFLRILSPTITTIGLAYKEQIVQTLPRTESDVPVHLIITEDTIYHCRMAKRT